VDTGNILTSQTRAKNKHAHFTSGSHESTQYSNYFSAFVAAARTPVHFRPHRDTLPPAPKTWKQMLSHIHSAEFKAAADIEIKALLSKGTFEYASILETDDTPLPVMWLFTYKFDEDGYLLKHKARIVARGDLQTLEEETYATTLAAQTFHAVMALVAGFDLKTRQYDTVNAFTNARLPIPIYCQSAEGYERQGKLWRVLMALYGLRKSPLLWYKDFTLSLADLGLEAIPDTNCLFVND